MLCFNIKELPSSSLLCYCSFSREQRKWIKI